MFARRKRKDPEDEPLVPHGLIWQATDDPESADDAGSANSQVSSEVIEMSLRNDIRSQGDAAVPGSGVGNAGSGSSQSIPTPDKLGAISPPIPWPSPRTASVIRRVPPPTEPALPMPPADQTSIADREHAAPPKRPPQSAPDQPPARVQQQQKFEIVELARTGSNGRSIFIPVTRGLASLGRLAGTVFDGTVRPLRNSRRKALTTYESLDLQAQIRRARHTAEKWVQGGIAGSRSVQDRFQAWWASRKPGVARSRSAVASFSSRAVSGFTARSAYFVQRARAHRVHIRIAKSASMQALVRRSRIALAQRSEPFRRDPRLWTSLAMASLSALLTLGVISAIRHQAPADSTRSSATRPSAPPTPVMNPAGLIAPQTALASTRQISKSASAPVKGSTQAKPSPAGTDNPPSTAARRVHHNDDEDYVAPDTYRYYGNGSGSR